MPVLGPLPFWQVLKVRRRRCIGYGGYRGVSVIRTGCLAKCHASAETPGSRMPCRRESVIESAAKRSIIRSLKPRSCGRTWCGSSGHLVPRQITAMPRPSAPGHCRCGAPHSSTISNRLTGAIGRGRLCHTRRQQVWTVLKFHWSSTRRRFSPTMQRRLSSTTTLCICQTAALDGEEGKAKERKKEGLRTSH